MIKLILEIEEKEKKVLEDITATNVSVAILKKGHNPTKNEEKICNILESKIDTKKPLQIINNTKEKTIEELLKLLVSI